MGIRLRDIVMLGVLAIAPGCTGGPGVGGFIAAGATVNSMNAAGRGNFRAAAGWAGVAEYGRAKVISDAAAGIRGGSDDDERDGVMTIRMRTQVYRGEVLDGRPHGTGKLQYSDGSRYEGEFRKGKREGFGRITDCDGRVWEGRYHNDLWDGEFVITDKNGRKSVRFYIKDQQVSREEYERAKERD